VHLWLETLPADLLYITRVQSKILVSLFGFGHQFVRNENFLKATGIAQSTWSDEQPRLMDLGLIEKKSFRVMGRSNVFTTVSFRLSPSGRKVAFNLLNISRVLSSTSIIGVNKNEHMAEILTKSKEKQVQQVLLESIEVALESFGPDLLELVKGAIEVEKKIAWERVAEAPEVLMQVMKDICGQDGSEIVAAMISENIRSLLGLERRESPELVSTMQEAKQKIALQQREDSMPFEIIRMQVS